MTLDMGCSFSGLIAMQLAMDERNESGAMVKSARMI